MTEEKDGNKVDAERQEKIQKIQAEGGASIENVTQVSGDYHEHHHYTQKEKSNNFSVYLPSKTYREFVGRKIDFERVVNALRTPGNYPVTVIVGLGGMGKTALAREAVEQAVQEELFDYIVWTSAKRESFIGEKSVSQNTTEYSFDSLLSEIARQSDRLDVAKLPFEQKKNAVQFLLANHQVLIVMDNLETVQENDLLVNDVFEILGQGKLLLTSRHQIKHEQGFVVNLSGFPEDEGITFLKEEGRARGISVVADADLSSLLEITAITGGAPLAMKLVAGQLSRQPMDFVLGSLKKASVHGQDYDFYRFIYFQSWEMLLDTGKMALVDMSVFPPLSGGALEDVEAVSQLEADDFWEAMDQLVTMSLVEKIGEVGKERFALHSLTYYFILSDITGEWEDD